MKKLSLLILAVAATAGARVQQDKSYLGIFVETKQMRIAGMKVRPMPKLPPGIKLPPQALAMMPGAPHRVLSVRLWSPSIAPDNATAWIAPPSGLKQGDRLDLELYRPKPAEGTGGGGQGGGDTSKPQDFTIKVYWGSSDTVQPGQPKIFNLGTMTNEQKMEFGERMKTMRIAQAGQGSYFYKDGWTTGYWPTEKQPGEIGTDAALPGTYSLTTSYCGNVSIDAPSNVDFLAPIEMTSPNLDQKPPLNTSIPFQWNPIPNALGEFATSMGMEGKNTLILWSSSEVYIEQFMADMGFLQMAEVKDMVSKKIFMSGDTTHVTIPAGIFQNSDFVMFNMVGYGPGAARDDVQPVPRIQTKSTLSIILGGKKSGGGGGDGDGG